MSSTYHEAMDEGTIPTSNSGDNTYKKDQDVDYSYLHPPERDGTVPGAERRNKWWIDTSDEGKKWAKSVLGLLRDKDQNGVQTIDSKTATKIIEASIRTNYFKKHGYTERFCDNPHLHEYQTVLNHAVLEFCTSLKEEKPELHDMWCRERAPEEVTLPDAKKSLDWYFSNPDRYM
ncbi:uncharacterized protein I206_106157 [Kwoniella pini CBS 10737]|uniref:Uncharacterized protein n=1 Tax=Kwoniella pini CBS 10737 TaxID=1296096 RepID=A0A1B9I175_9TREE|nr:uncharacterized protein I206_04982 [Kwoniella pini CBS 10737]OCF49293.1 hypothetical protein I206_04982 [Kwoniella pini CBS 10737]